MYARMDAVMDRMAHVIPGRRGPWFHGCEEVRPDGKLRHLEGSHGGGVPGDERIAARLGQEGACCRKVQPDARADSSSIDLQAYAPGDPVADQEAAHGTGGQMDTAIEPLVMRAHGLASAAAIPAEPDAAPDGATAGERRARVRHSTVLLPMLAGEVMASLGRVVLMRRRTYELLGLAFRPPTPRSVARVLRDGPFVLEQIVSAAPFHALTEALSLLSALAGGGPSGDALESELAPEYDRLFSAGDCPLCPPCEGLFLHRDLPAADVRQAYRAIAFSPARVLHAPADHIAVELAFMAELCRRQFRALVESGMPAADRLALMQRRFLEGHLGRWAPGFGTAARQRTTHDFYRAAALALPVWLGLDRGFVRSLLEPPTEMPGPNGTGEVKR